jgi:hypothetical protein
VELKGATASLFYLIIDKDKWIAELKAYFFRKAREPEGNWACVGIIGCETV